MNRTKTAVIGIAAMAVALVANGQAMAQGPGGPGGPPARLATKLNLTDEQKAAWQAAFQQMRTTTAPLREQSKQIRTEMKAMFDQGSPDPTALGQKVIALHAIRTQMREAHKTMESATSAVLTADQKQQLDTIKASMPHHGHFKRGGPPAPPVTQ
jgi:Spy/CpxP family protein refolding chaperone